MHVAPRPCQARCQPPAARRFWFIIDPLRVARAQPRSPLRCSLRGCRAHVRRPRRPASGTPEPGLSWLSSRIPNSSITPALAPSGWSPGLGCAPRALPATRPPARRGAPRRAPAYLAAVAHAEEVVLQHLHGAGPGGVHERASEDVRQGRHPGGTHVAGRAQARGPRVWPGARGRKTRRRFGRLR